MDEPTNGYAMDGMGWLWQKSEGYWTSARTKELIRWEDIGKRMGETMQGVTVTPDTPIYEPGWASPVAGHPFEAHWMTSVTETFCGDIGDPVARVQEQWTDVAKIECVCHICLVEWTQNIDV